MKRLRSVAVLPTMFTLGNLLCGFFAIAVAARVEAPQSIDAPLSAGFESFNPGYVVGAFDPANPVHNMMLCGMLIFLAMVFDALDGHVARLTRNTSNFGAELDSLCDLVTFGVAPAFLLVKMCPSFTYLHREAVWIIAGTFVACAAMRLARFNVESDEEDDHSTFSGLPVPAAAAAISSFALMFYTLRKDSSVLAFGTELDRAIQLILPIFAVLVSLLMVSRVPYPHLFNRLARGQKSFPHMIALLFAAFSLLIVRGYAIPIAAISFVLVPLVLFGLRWMHSFKEKPEPMF